jgi:hypothetical protein
MPRKSNTRAAEADPTQDDDIVMDNAIFDEERPGPGSAGQSGDTQGLSELEGATSESVLELIEEGQAFEAGIVAGIEDAPDADAGPIRTREVPEDDVPEEYDEKELGDQR